MHYRELLKGINAYASEGKITMDVFPKEPYKEQKEYFDAFDAQKLKSERAKIIINKWGKCRRHIDDEKLDESLKNFDKKYKSSLDWKLCELSLWQHRNRILEIFKNFVDVVKYTGTSKLLHILNPEFFMIWDQAVRHGYGCSYNEEGYFNFLFRSQKEIQELLKTYKADKGNIKNISKKAYKGKEKTILKLLDEYNWARYKKGWIKGCQK